MLSHPHLVLQPNQAPAKIRRFHVVTGIAGEKRSLMINNANLDTLAAALLERMYYCKIGENFVEPPRVEKAHFFKTMKDFKICLLKKFGKQPTRLCPEDFVALFRGRKRTIYENALEEYYEEGVQRKHAVSIAFVKCEKVRPEKAARCIQPRKPVYNIGVGTYLKHIEHRLYKAIAKVFGEDIVVMKGLNVREVGEVVAERWYSFADPVAVGLDAIKFDMHVSAEGLEWEHSIYTSLYNGCRELARLLKFQINNRGVGYCDDGKLRYKVKGRRFSGDMNTALGNCLIMCAMVWSYARSRGVDIRFINNGDDCQIFMERKDLGRFLNGLDSWFLKMGFRMTQEEPVYNLEEVEFCQMRCLKTAYGHTMVRNFETAREKDTMCLFPLASKSAFEKWIYAVGECGLALTAGIPIMQEMYSCFMRHGKASKFGDAVQFQSGAAFLRVRMESKWEPVTDESRVSFMMAWGFTPDEQTALEEYYQQLTLSYSPNPVDNLNDINGAPL